MAAAVAYTRSAGLPEFRPLSRYQDPLLLGAVAQLYAAVRLAMAHGRPGRLLFLGWSAVALAGLISLTATHFSLNLPYKRAEGFDGLDRRAEKIRATDRYGSSPRPPCPPRLNCLGTQSLNTAR